MAERTQWKGSRLTATIENQLEMVHVGAWMWRGTVMCNEGEN